MHVVYRITPSSQQEDSNFDPDTGGVGLDTLFQNC